MFVYRVHLHINKVNRTLALTFYERLNVCDYEHTVINVLSVILFFFNLLRD